MKIPVEWLKEYVDINKTSKEIAESFTLLGLLLDKPVFEYTSGTYKTDILDLEHRMDRSDWLSVLGCARDVAAFEGLKLKHPQLYAQKGKTPKPEQIVKIDVLCPDKVNRFNTRVFRNIKVKPSPDWLKNRLEAYGIPSINNIVDITNYVMVEMGQPLHAQDLAKMEKPEIIIRNAKSGEKIVTLLGETIELTPEAFVLTQNDKPTVIGGIVGGRGTGVDEKTTDIVLDAGNYNQNVIRKVSRKLKIQNETVLRCDKFLHPALTEIAIQRAAGLILELAGGDYYENVDWYLKEVPNKTFTLRYSRLAQVSGMQIDSKRVEAILGFLEYKILNKTDTENKKSIKLEVPYFRTDIEVEDDIVADILRINNYENIPLNQIQAAPPKEITPAIYKFEEKLRDICVNAGLHEHITDPLVPKDTEAKDQIVLENALSSEKSALRTTIYETLYPVVETYIKHQIKEIGLFEVGKTYHMPIEEVRTLEVIYQNDNLSAKENSDKVKKICAAILRENGIKWGHFSKFGKLTPNSISIKTEEMFKYVGKPGRVSTTFDQNYTEDLSIILDITQKFGEAFNFINAFDPAIINTAIIEEYAIDKKQKSLLLRVTFTSAEKGRELKEKLVSGLKEKFNIALRK